MEGFSKKVGQDVISKRKRFFQAKGFLGGKARCLIFRLSIFVFLRRVERMQRGGSQARIEKFLTHQLRRHFWGRLDLHLDYVLSPGLGTHSKGQHFEACGLFVGLFVFFKKKICHFSGSEQSKMMTRQKAPRVEWFLLLPK